MDVNMLVVPVPTIVTGLVAHAGVACTTDLLVHVPAKTLEYNGGMGNPVRCHEAAPGTTVPT
ncbi:hypothetical protein [Amycolatopsis sp. WQ 127309]|uniref:hypothetical protein n=1 Tax=Amycolatopsis sp. WQ 127309 TaxID=2932773 RepID=UPI001FF4403E|nr:hypothetical protein [Amycolatopsis sp. WQ 127309]UOZ05867.1 hypothetical protein MUY22_44770 [Amycolatopsis sp. WQ 127309]